MAKTPRGKSKRNNKKQKRSTLGLSSKNSAKSKGRTRRKSAIASRSPPRHRPIDEMVDAGTLALGLPLEADWRAGVIANLDLILQRASLLVDFSLPDECEPAPIFRA
jgi:hypothetical protein